MTTTLSGTRALTRIPVTAFARGPVLAVAGGLGLLLLLTNWRYGFFGDELYFLAAGRHLDWGYVDQPPLVPLIARALELIAPGSLWVLRLPAVLAMVAGVVCTALIARELGGGRPAQLLGAATFAVCSHFVTSGHLLATSTLDPLLWTVTLWLIVRWMRTRADGLLVWLGVVTAVAINVKFLVLGFWFVAGICLLIWGPRELLRRPSLWIGAGIAALGALPTVIWQAAHGWPQLEFSRSVAAEVEYLGGRLAFLPGVLATAGVLVGSVLFGYGVWRLLREPELRPYRFLGWTTVGLAVLFLAVNGRFYYLAGMYPICWAAAAVTIERRRPARWWRWLPTWPVYLVNALVVLLLALPLRPESMVRGQPSFSSAELSWPRFTAAVATEWRALPPATRGHTAILTESYWQASAISQYGPARGLPEPYSGDRGYSTLGTPPAGATTVLYAGADPSVLRRNFTGVRKISDGDPALAGMGWGQHVPIWLATGRTRPWSALWPEFRDV